MGLGFTTPAYLLLLPLAALPIVLHFRSRQKVRSLDFSGAYFLDRPAIPMSGKNRKLEDLLLLALRCGLLALALLTLSGPEFSRTSWVPAPQFGGTGTASTNMGREAWVIVLDDSPSMAWSMGESHRLRWPVIVRSVMDQLRGYPQRRIGIECASGRSIPFFEASDAAAHIPEILNLNPCLSGDRAAAMERATRQLAAENVDRKGILLISDFQRNQREGSGDELVTRYRAALTPANGTAIPLLAWDCSEESRSQWSVEVLRPERTSEDIFSTHVQGEARWLTINVQALKGGGTRTLRVESAPILSDSRGEPRLGLRTKLFDAPITLEPGVSFPIRIPVLSEQPGGLWVRARLDGGDAYPFDDEAQTVLNVEPLHEVRIWDLRANGTPEPLEQLQAAIHPWAVKSSANRVQVKTLGYTTGTENPQAFLNKAPAGALLMLLHDPDGLRLNADEAEALHAAVQSGLVALTLPDFSAVKADLPKLSGKVIASGPLYPRALEGIEIYTRSSFEKPSSDVKQGWSVFPEKPADAAFSLFDIFQGSRNGDLGRVAFGARLRFVLDPGLKKDHVLLQFEDQAPGVVFKREGDGAWLQCAFGLERAGLVKSPAWPILLACWTECATRDRTRVTPPDVLFPGTPSAEWTVPQLDRERIVTMDGPWDLSHDPLPGMDLDTIPDAQRWELVAAPRSGVISMPTLDRPGLYRLKDRERTAWAVSRIHPWESSAERLPAAIQDQLLKAVRNSGGVYVRGLEHASEIAQATIKLQPGRSLNPLAWVLFGVAMLLELFILAWRGRAA